VLGRIWERYRNCLRQDRRLQGQAEQPTRVRFQQTRNLVKDIESFLPKRKRIWQWQGPRQYYTARLGHHEVPRAEVLSDNQN
jgi:hypothetical protein